MRRVPITGGGSGIGWAMAETFVGARAKVWVTDIVPGVLDACPAEVRAGHASGTSMLTWVSRDDIAAMAVFLASPAARFVSGQSIAVDGHTLSPDSKV